MTINPVAAVPTPDLGARKPTTGTGAGARLAGRVLLALAIVALLFVGAYALAWYRASQLATRFMADAESSYSTGKYIEALTGYETFDQATNSYVTHGGYMKVARIWSDPQAWPRPANAAQAEARIVEILDQKLMIEDAEGFVQANIGKANPYMGVIYLRLGELYEQEGDSESAKTIYGEIAELFPAEAELIARAEAHLTALDSR